MHWSGNKGKQSHHFRGVVIQIFKNINKWKNRHKKNSVQIQSILQQ